MITALIGHRGVGKTTLLKRLEVLFSHHEDVLIKDLDFEIETMHRRSIPSIFEKGGESEFRKLEAETFAKLYELHANSGRRVFIAIGAGFDFTIPERVHVVWVRRPNDAGGRVFLNRPRLSDEDPLVEWNKRFKTRDIRYRHFADEELTLPEGSLHDRVLEEHFFTAQYRSVPYTLTALPANFRSPDFFEKRLRWGLKEIELRDDLLKPEQIEHLLEQWSREKILYAIRKPRTARVEGGVRHDWALELGVPSFPVEIVSLHERSENLKATFDRIGKYPGAVQKLAVEVRDFSELLEGHRWWRQDPERRAFLPSSTTGRWQWYRQLFGPQMPVHFFREGDGVAPDQPFLWQTLSTPKWNKGFAAILGSPVTRSWTPTFQREFFDPYLMPVVAVEVAEHEFDQAMPILLELGLRAAAVTSPLKGKARALSKELTPEAKRFAAVNTLAWSERGWVGHNTDFEGASVLMRGEFTDPNIPVLVWGGGGTKAMLQQLLPNAIFVSARAGRRLNKPTYLVWAVGRDREFQWPEPPVYIQGVVDLNYSEDSPGREIAQRAGSPYKSGETMFIHQGLHQREFWKRYL